MATEKAVAICAIALVVIGVVTRSFWIPFGVAILCGILTAIIVKVVEKIFG